MSKQFFVMTPGANAIAQALLLALSKAGASDPSIAVQYAKPNDLNRLIDTELGRHTRAIIMAEEGITAKQIRGTGPADASRKDIFVGAVVKSTGLARDAQYLNALDVLKGQSINLVLAHDTENNRVMIVAPELAVYDEGTDLEKAIIGFAEMIVSRTNATFTRSTVVEGSLVAWNSPEIPRVLREVVNHCIRRGAYKPFRGVTVGHFAVRAAGGHIITSVRRSDFNHLAETGMVRIQRTGKDEVIAFGQKPSVGGQSQAIIFTNHQDADCIVHFHCPMRPGASVNIREQRPYECGSHECGENTSEGLRASGPVKAVFLDGHGPNIVFGADADPDEVIAWIEENFDLAGRTDLVTHISQEFVHVAA